MTCRRATKLIALDVVSETLQDRTLTSTLEIQCPLCGQHSRVPTSFAGKLGKCPGCLGEIRVPQAPAEPTPTLVAPEIAPTVVDLQTDLTAAPPPARAKACPSCGESVKERAKKCRYCGEFFDRAERLISRRRHEMAPPWAFPAMAAAVPAAWPITIHVGSIRSAE